jgi:hypothetical protein
MAKLVSPTKGTQTGSRRPKNSPKIKIRERGEFMEDKEYEKYLPGMVSNPDGSVKYCCGVIPMIGILIAFGSAIVQNLHFS